MFDVCVFRYCFFFACARHAVHLFTAPLYWPKWHYGAPPFIAGLIEMMLNWFGVDLISAIHLKLRARSDRFAWRWRRDRCLSHRKVFMDVAELSYYNRNVGSIVETPKIHNRSTVLHATKKFFASIRRKRFTILWKNKTQLWKAVTNINSYCIDNFNYYSEKRNLSNLRWHIAK